MFEKFNKLCSMNRDELQHRVRERLRRETDRLRFRFGLDHDYDLPQCSLIDYLQRGPARRFYASTQDRVLSASFVEECFPDWLDKAVLSAGRLCEHRVDILAFKDVSLGGDIDWHRDPISGYNWPRKFWVDYDLVLAPPADAKIIHELNRHQHLPRLAKAYFLTGDEPYAREAVYQMLGWIDENPRWIGINWQSSLEIAIRSISWMWTLFLVLQSRSLDEASARRICISLCSQLDHIYRYPSTYSSPNTHLIGEAAALFIGGLLFRELPRAEKWRQFGALTLLSEMQRQVSEDGVYGELSTYYHCYAADFYLQALILARLNRVPFPEWMWTRASHMLEFVLHMSRPDGTLPLLGDDDGGRVLAIASEDYRSFGDGLSTGAVLFGREDFKFQAGRFREESFWLLGDDAWPIFDSITARVPPDPGRNFTGAGYFVQRTGWESRDSHLVFDCGGFGLSSGGHAHADALSFTLFTGGHDFIIDPATSTYNGGPQWRTFFRSTQAHNTVVVDGRSQSDAGGTFSWKRKANATLSKHISLAGIEYIDGEHAGYAGETSSIRHRRRLIHVRPDYWIILDDFAGRGEHQYEFLCHFAPQTHLNIFGDEGRGEVDCRAAIEDARLQMFLYASDAVQAQAVCGQEGPIQGWSSTRYGERRPSPVLRTCMKSFAPAGLMTFLIPGAGEGRSRRFNTGTDHAIAAAVRNGDHDDVAVMCWADTELHLIDCSMRGEFFWIRMHNGAPTQLFAVNARAFVYGGEKIFESAEIIPYVQVFFWEHGMVIERGEDEGKVYVRDLRDRQFQRN